MRPQTADSHPSTMQGLFIIFVFASVFTVAAAAGRHENLPAISTVTINGEEYLATPQEMNPDLAEDMVWSQFPPDAAFLSDYEWYDGVGQDKIIQRRIWSIPDEDGQLVQIRQLLHEFPNRGPDLMYAAVERGKSQIVWHLVQAGVLEAALPESFGRDKVPPTIIAAYEGQLECLKILITEGNIDPNIRSAEGATALMYACLGSQTAVVDYLLNIADADYNVTTPRNGSAINAAAENGCQECIEMILDRANDRNEAISSLITAETFWRTVQSDLPEMLTFLLNKTGYPLVGESKSWELDFLLCEEDMKAQVEEMFLKALATGKVKVLPTLHAYVKVIHKGSLHENAKSRDKVADMIPTGMAHVAEGDSGDHLQGFEMLWNMTYNEDAYFTNEQLVSYKQHILDDAFFAAAQYGSLNMSRFIASKHPNLDVNHRSEAVNPVGTTSLIGAAMYGHKHIVEYLLAEFADQLQINETAGDSPQCPTALWVAVWYGHVEIVELLLKKGGSQLYWIDPTARPADGPKSVIISVTKATDEVGKSVRIFSKETVCDEVSIPVHGLGDEGAGEDEEGFALRWLRLNVSQSDLEWWDNLQLYNPETRPTWYGRVTKLLFQQDLEVWKAMGRLYHTEPQREEPPTERFPYLCKY